MKHLKFGDKVSGCGYLLKEPLEYFNEPSELQNLLSVLDTDVFIQKTYRFCDAPFRGVVIGKVTLNTELHLRYEEDDPFRPPYVHGSRDNKIKVVKVATAINQIALVPIECIEQVHE